MRRRSRLFLLAIVCVLFLGVGGLVVWELRNSWFQSLYFSDQVRKLTFTLRSGPSDAIRFPETGPYDTRLGFTRLKGWTGRLAEQGFVVEAQSRWSPDLLDLVDQGTFAIYREKSQAGVQLLDRRGRPIFERLFPRWIYRSFEEVPTPVRNALLFIENRELLEPRYPYKNPAVEWDRFAKALFDFGLKTVRPGKRTAGGSTLATQIEKFRHSPGGRTASSDDKLKQMISATYRSYLEGRTTFSARERLVLDYLNSIPLAAVSRFGEVVGFGDGLFAWYGLDFDLLNQVLRTDFPDDDAQQNVYAALYKQMLSLFVAQRRPSFYLRGGRERLNNLTNRYLQLLATADIIPEKLSEKARALDLKFSEQPFPALEELAEQKAGLFLRGKLLSYLDLPSFYELDRVDLVTQATVDQTVQREVEKFLRSIRDGATWRKLGLQELSPDSPQSPPSGIVLALTLYERVGSENLLRVQADTLDAPLDLNQGVKLDLGSTAKLRTLITYLQAIESLSLRARKGELKPHPRDRLGTWVIQFLKEHPKAEVRDVLDAALDRRYSASPHETFFTGGGQHTFVNFNKDDNNRIMPVREALRHSVNLVFVRLMRDLVNYYIFGSESAPGAVLETNRDARRSEYLKRFADREGKVFLRRFYTKYRGKSREEVHEVFFQSIRSNPVRLTAAFRALDPQASKEQLGRFLRQRLAESAITDQLVDQLYRRYDNVLADLADRGYIARVHPLELWLVSFLMQHPKASLEEAISNSADARQEVYRWLFRTRHKGAQDRRIRTMLEVEAFTELHADWVRVGYPFDYLTPSYATSIGSSADKPAALAELMGILSARGMRYPTRLFTRLHFAAGTPYETVFAAKSEGGERVLSEAVSDATLSAIYDVVQNGTGRRLREGIELQPKGTPLQIGGKTGTGDHRFEVYNAAGHLVRERVLNRTATFTFVMGDRFFGTLLAWVPGDEAKHYRFTSALPVQILKLVAPALQPLGEGHTGADTLRPRVEPTPTVKPGDKTKDPVKLHPSPEALISIG